MDVKNTHSVTKTEISVFGRQALDAERRRSPSLADKVLKTLFMYNNDARIAIGVLQWAVSTEPRKTIFNVFDNPLGQS